MSGFRVVVTGLTGWRTGHSFVLWDNLAETAAVVDASSEESGYEADLASTWLAGAQRWRAGASGDQWIRFDLGSAQSVDSFGFYGHNLGDVAATFSCQYSSNGTDWTDFLDEEQAASNDTVYRMAEAATSARYWRIRLQDCTAAPTIACVVLGVSLQLYTGPDLPFSPPPWADNSTVTNGESEGGEVLSRRIQRRGSKVKIEIGKAPDAWIRANYLAFKDHALLKPFLYSWNYEEHPEDGRYCYTKEDTMPPVTYDAVGHASHSFEVVAL